MKKRSEILTLSRLKEVIHYDMETGVFTMLPGAGRGQLLRPKPAGTVKNQSGYRRIQIDGVIYGGNQLAWFYVTGEWPDRQIDHRNRDTSDDRFYNLRLATQTQNKANSGAYKNNGLGIKGVRLHRNGQFEARLRIHAPLRHTPLWRL